MGAERGHGERPAFVLHHHRRPRPHHDLRLEEDGVLRSWALPRGLPDNPARNRLAVEVADHDLKHLMYEDEHKTIADLGWWELHDRTGRRFVFTLHGCTGSHRYALIHTGRDWLLHSMQYVQPDPQPTTPPFHPESAGRWWPPTTRRTSSSAPWTGWTGWTGRSASRGQVGA